MAHRTLSDRCVAPSGRRRLGERIDDVVDNRLDQHLSSPSPITRITGSVPEGRITRRPLPLSLFSALVIAEMTLASSSGLPFL